MRQSGEIRFVTLVVALLVVTRAYAAKETPPPDLGNPVPTQQELMSPDTFDDEITRSTLDVPEAPANLVRPDSQLNNEYFYPFRQALTFRAGMAYSTKERNGTTTPTTTGVQFAFTTTQGRSYEAGADLLSDGTGLLQFGKRWNYSRTKLRPYTKLGGSVLVAPEDRLVTFAKYENYRLVGAAGAEYLIKTATSVRIDVEGSLSSQAVTVAGTLGYVWAW